MINKKYLFSLQLPNFFSIVPLQIVALLFMTLMSLKTEAELRYQPQIILSSDYFRHGISLTNHGASIRGQVHFEHDSGIEGGVKMGNTNDTFASETDIYVHFQHLMTPNIILDIGIDWFDYPSASTNFGNPDYNEFFFQFRYEKYKNIFNGKLSYSTKFFGVDTGVWHYSLGYDFALIENLYAQTNLSFNSFDDKEVSQSKDFWNYLLGISKKINFMENQSRIEKSSSIEGSLSLNFSGTNRKLLTQRSTYFSTAKDNALFITLNLSL
jgi:uncharacterized protein (TIGR02001 family)